MPLPTPNIWYVETNKQDNPLQPNISIEPKPRMYIRRMTKTEIKAFPVKVVNDLYSIRDENGKELGVTDDSTIALKLAKNFGMILSSVH